MIPGTYAAVTYSEESLDRLFRFANAANIPNLVDLSDVHTTVIFSKEPVPHLAHGTIDLTQANLFAYPDRFESWLTRPMEGVSQTRCLILTLESEHLIAYQQLLSRCFNVIYDFEKYTPHIALSYDIADFQYAELHDKVSEIGKLDVVSFYAEDLDLTWSPSLGKKHA